jgi:hypothetical protein
VLTARVLESSVVTPFYGLFKPYSEAVSSSFSRPRHYLLLLIFASDIACTQSAYDNLHCVVMLVWNEQAMKEVEALRLIISLQLTVPSKLHTMRGKGSNMDMLM